MSASRHDNPTIDPGQAAPDTPTLAGPPSSLISADLVAAEGGRIGPYTLLSVIGEGGFGIVYLAEQTEPIQRRVALKVVKPGMDSRAVLGRFEAERRALAIIDHPNVARVLDAGVTERGRPYFVMEYVAGEPITAYCDRHRLSTRQRLELFIPVCEAVHHGHTKGIIHRDVKPSNILVAVVGERPIPKVIDFGVAKALHDRSSGVANTEIGQVVGTPEYMSPEQAEMSALDVDTRTDVYALGVVLYELLTGVLPLDSRTIRKLSLVEMQRVIREVDPPRPSTRLSTLVADDQKHIADHRRAELHALASELSAELEWIPLKAMRKDRTERYRSAVELADDIRNYLEGRPLIAGPESATYRLRKYVRRHRLQVGAAAAVLVVLVGGLVGVSLALAEARAANQRAQELRTQLLAVQQQLMAQGGGGLQGGAVEPGSLALGGGGAPAPAPASTDAPNASQPAGASKDTVETSASPTAEAPDAPDRLAEVEKTQRRVVELSIATLGAEHPDTLLSRRHLATMLVKRGRLDEAETLLRQVMEARSRTGGAASAPAVAAAAELGGLLLQRGKSAEAEAVLKQALERAPAAFGGDDPRLIAIEGDLARAYRAQRKHAEALTHFSNVAQARARVSGKEQPPALVAAAAKGVAEREAGKLAESEATLAAAVQAMRRVMGENHPVAQAAARELALTLIEAKEFERARVILADLHGHAAQRFGVRARITQGLAADLAQLFEAWGKPDEAAQWHQRSESAPGGPRP